MSSGSTVWRSMASRFFSRTASAIRYPLSFPGSSGVTNDSLVQESTCFLEYRIDALNSASELTFHSQVLPQAESCRQQAASRRLRDSRNCEPDPGRGERRFELPRDSCDLDS